MARDLAGLSFEARCRWKRAGFASPNEKCSFASAWEHNNSPPCAGLQRERRRWLDIFQLQDGLNEFIVWFVRIIHICFMDEAVFTSSLCTLLDLTA